MRHDTFVVCLTDDAVGSSSTTSRGLPSGCAPRRPIAAAPSTAWTAAADGRDAAGEVGKCEDLPRDGSPCGRRRGPGRPSRPRNRRRHVEVSHSARSWNTVAILLLGAAVADGMVTCSPSISMRPVSGASTPEIIFASVDLPAPLLTTRAQPISCVCTSMSTSTSALTALNLLVMSASRAGDVAVHLFTCSCQSTPCVQWSARPPLRQVCARSCRSRRGADGLVGVDPQRYAGRAQREGEVLITSARDPSAAATTSSGTNGLETPRPCDAARAAAQQHLPVSASSPPDDDDLRVDGHLEPGDDAADSWCRRRRRPARSAGRRRWCAGRRRAARAPCGCSGGASEQGLRAGRRRGTCRCCAARLTGNSTGMWPIAPAVPPAPRCTCPPMTMPAPTRRHVRRGVAGLPGGATWTRRSRRGWRRRRRRGSGGASTAPGRRGRRPSPA